MPIYGFAQSAWRPVHRTWQGSPAVCRRAIQTGCAPGLTELIFGLGFPSLKANTVSMGVSCPPARMWNDTVSITLAAITCTAQFRLERWQNQRQPLFGRPYELIVEFPVRHCTLNLLIFPDRRLCQQPHLGQGRQHFGLRPGFDDHRHRAKHLAQKATCIRSAQLVQDIGFADL